MALYRMQMIGVGAQTHCQPAPAMATEVSSHFSEKQKVSCTAGNESVTHHNDLDGFVGCFL